MKSILTLVMFFSLLTGINANHNKATIIIKSQNHIPIIVELDNHHNDYAQNVHQFENVRPGNHFVEIFQVRNPHHPHGSNTLYRGNVKAYVGYQAIYQLDRGRLMLVSKNRFQPLYSNTCSCPNHGHCNHSGCGCNSCSGSSNYNNWNHPNWNNGYSNNGQCGTNHGYQNNNWSNNNYQGYYDGWPNNPQQNQYNYSGPNNNYKGVMSPQQFDGFMQGLKANYMDGDKVKYIKANLNDENLDIDQVQIVLNEVFFESNKVEAAKFLYTKTDKKAQFGTVLDDFKFSSSKRELNTYISNIE